MDGRAEIVDDVAGADGQVRTYIASEVRALLDNPDFVGALPGFLLPDAASQARRRILEDRLHVLSRLATA